ncbi:MAG TPA: molybdopterin-guanine dinucleotide biosynthesis protein B [Steroidobacteraceae bacterium]|nr:molybdopterin-guanine dinucleotide biosynthesis protein B [Steroidobacteraceae bacterium]
MTEARVLGIVGWSGAGKTTLLTKLIPLLSRRGLRVATLKHAHHAFDVDQAGKDSYEHRRAGACEVLVSSARRWVQMHEVGDAEEASLPELLQRVSPCDLILVEGFKTAQHFKLEVFRQANGKAPLHPDDARIIAVASDQAFPDARLTVVALDDIPAIADVVQRASVPLTATLAALAGQPTSARPSA